MAEPLTPSLSRCDLLPSALIFGGLLVAMTAVGGAMDGTSAQWVDEIKVVAGENMTGTDEMDLLAACKKNRQSRPTSPSQLGELARECRQNSTVEARPN